MMEKIGLKVDEIVATRATGIQYSFVHLEKKAKEDVLAKALKTLEEDGVMGSEIYGYSTVSGNTPSTLEHLEDHPGFQTLVDHEERKNDQFHRWTADGYRETYCGYTLLKNKLLAKRGQLPEGGETSTGSAAADNYDRGTHRTPSDVDEEEDHIPRQSNDERNKRQRTTSSDHDGQNTITLDVMIASLSSAIQSAVSSSVSSTSMMERQRTDDAQRQLQKMGMLIERRSIEDEVAAKYEARMKAKDDKIKKLKDELAEISQVMVGI
jgi:hypothetical protein